MKTIRQIRLFALTFIVLSVCLISTVGASAQTPTPGAPPKDPRNLVENPSFEPPFIEDKRTDGGGFVASGWQAWWYNDAGDEFDAPEFKPAEIFIDPNRVRSGGTAQQYFRPWARHQAGVYQVVNVPVNSSLRFSAYGQSWSTNAENPNPADSADGGLVGEVRMRIGIDPTGGTNPFSRDVFWSPTREVYDSYERFTVDTTAQGDTVTVFTYSAPRWPWATNNVYWDDAALIVTAPGQAGTPDPDATPDPDETPGASGTTSGSGVDLELFLEDVRPAEVQPPREDGTQWHVVQLGDTLLGIAVAYGISPNQLVEQNNLSSETIFVGQELFISETLVSPEEAAAAEEAVPEEEVVVEEESQGQICLTLFNDIDGNSQWGTGEDIIPGGLLTLSGDAELSLTTNAGETSRCFTGLAEGDYTLSVETPEGFELTGQAEFDVTLGQDSEVAFTTGAVESTSEGGSEGSVSDTASDRSASPLGIIGAVIVLLIAAAGGVATYFFVTSQGNGEASYVAPSEIGLGDELTRESRRPDASSLAPTIEAERPDIEAEDEEEAAEDEFDLPDIEDDFLD